MICIVSYINFEICRIMLLKLPYYYLTDPYMPCFKNFTKHSGIIRSPNYPDNCPAYYQCEYYISARPGEKIVLKFLDADLSYGGSIVVSLLVLSYHVDKSLKSKTAKWQRVPTGPLEPLKALEFEKSILRSELSLNFCPGA